MPGLPPIITIHSDNDNGVPYSQAVRLHAALDKADVPNKLITIQGAKHGGFSKQDLIDRYAAIGEFMYKHGVF